MFDGVPEPADDAPAASTAKHRPNRLDQRYRVLPQLGRRVPAVTELLPRKAAPLVPSAAHGRSGCSSAGASDGIRTRVNGFAGRCLATQPHPQQSGLFHRRRPTPTDWFSVIANPTQVGVTVSACRFAGGRSGVARRPRTKQSPDRRTAHRVRVDGADRPGARGARQERRAAHPGHRGNRVGVDPDRQQVRLLRRPQSRHGRGGPVPGRRPNRLGHRLSRRRTDHHPAGRGARTDHRRGDLGVRGDRHGRRGRPGEVGHPRDVPALRHRARFHSADESPHRATGWVGATAHHLRAETTECWAGSCRSANNIAGRSPNSAAIPTAACCSPSRDRVSDARPARWPGSTA